MPRCQLKDKSPHHSSALRIQDVHPGRRFIVFNLGLGIQHAGVFMCKPFADYQLMNDHSPSLQVLIKEDDGEIQEVFLEDMGIVAHGTTWNDRNFTIDARKQHLLPKVNIKKFPMPGSCFDDDDDMLWW